MFHSGTMVVRYRQLWPVQLTLPSLRMYRNSSSGGGRMGRSNSGPSDRKAGLTPFKKAARNSELQALTGMKASQLGLDKFTTPTAKILEEDWTDLWPVSRRYDHNLVQLPVRMGRPTVKGEPPVDAEGNAELLKIPNFLHLTPRHIEKHTKALKPLCKPWPKNVEQSSRVVRVRTNNHVFPGASSRHPRSHIVQLLIHIDDIPGLDARAQKKLIALAGKRYRQKTQTVSLVCKECPLREQNQDYALFQLLALWKEALKKEEWEVTADMQNVRIYEL